MEEVYNPHQQANQGQYVPQQQAYSPPQQQYMPPPQQQQQQWSPPVQQQQWENPQQQQPAQPQNAGWGQPAPQSQQQWGQPTQQQGQSAQQQQQQQQPRQGQSQVTKLPCRTKQMERMNLITMDGYISNPKGGTSQSGTNWYTCLLIWEDYVYQNGQQMVNPDGTPATRDVRFSFHAWGPVAQSLAQIPEGTPVRFIAAARRRNKARQGEPANWDTDFMVHRFEIF